MYDPCAPIWTDWTSLQRKAHTWYYPQACHQQNLILLYINTLIHVKSTVHITALASTYGHHMYQTALTGPSSPHQQHTLCCAVLCPTPQACLARYDYQQHMCSKEISNMVACCAQLSHNGSLHCKGFEVQVERYRRAQQQMAQEQELRHQQQQQQQQ